MEPITPLPLKSKIKVKILTRRLGRISQHRIHMLAMFWDAAKRHGQTISEEDGTDNAADVHRLNR
ncbi:MAG: hypothetical protein JSV56_10610 [Methanomassiliicoccales archaeon]|nr:MAG: hypothetical protein JSV56_10610 [Methanomassiliicoccales archaeon]